VLLKVVHEFNKPSTQIHI